MRRERAGRRRRNSSASPDIPSQSAPSAREEIGAAAPSKDSSPRPGMQLRLRSLSTLEFQLLSAAFPGEKAGHLGFVDRQAEGLVGLDGPVANQGNQGIVQRHHALGLAGLHD